MTKHKVAILGASPKPERYSNMLITRLHVKGHEVFPINPTIKEIDGIYVYPNLEALPQGIDVLSVYLNESQSNAIADSMVACGIPKVIFNPGAENPGLKRRLEEKGVEVEDACSLVLSGLDQL